MGHTERLIIFINIVESSKVEGSAEADFVRRRQGILKGEVSLYH